METVDKKIISYDEMVKRLDMALQEGGIPREEYRIEPEYSKEFGVTIPTVCGVSKFSEYRYVIYKAMGLALSPYLGKQPCWKCYNSSFVLTKPEAIQRGLDCVEGRCPYV